jgi:hypothetical protein
MVRLASSTLLPAVDKEAAPAEEEKGRNLGVDLCLSSSNYTDMPRTDRT